MANVSPLTPSTLPEPYLPLMPSLANPILQAELTERINGKTKSMAQQLTPL